MKARRGRPTNKYWPVLLLDLIAVAVLVFVAVRPHASPWWRILAAMWGVVAALRAINEYKSRRSTATR